MYAAKAGRASTVSERDVESMGANAPREAPQAKYRPRRDVGSNRFAAGEEGASGFFGDTGEIDWLVPSIP